MNLNHTHARNKPFKVSEVKAQPVINTPVILFRGAKQRLGTSASGMKGVELINTKT